MSVVVGSRLVDEIRAGHEFDAEACMSCGVCSAVCPLAIDVLPRALFRQALLGMEDAVLAGTDTVFSCLLCGLCEESCPAGVHITENVRALRRYLNGRLYATGGAS